MQSISTRSGMHSQPLKLTTYTAQFQNTLLGAVLEDTFNNFKDNIATDAINITLHVLCSEAKGVELKTYG